MTIKEAQNTKKLFKEFSGIKEYMSKLEFFDQHFGIVPFEFPDFSPELNFLLRGDGKSSLMEIYQKERRQTLQLSREIEHPSGMLVFNVFPVNTEREILNDFLINRFLKRDKGFITAIEEIEKISGVNRQLLERPIMEANSLVDVITYNVTQSRSNGFHGQFIQTFYNGYTDYQFKFIKHFPNKRKLMELYLYAQGVLFAKYVESLDKNRFIGFSVQQAELKNRLALFYKHGIVELLQKKLRSNQKVVELISEMIGEQYTLVEKLLKHK